VAELTRELLRQQAELQAEADGVEVDLQLAALLEPLGEPVRVGSAALGLMVWRDLDLTVVCKELALEAVAAVGAHLAAHARVRQVTFRNDTGHWNTNPSYPDGLYLGVEYRSPARHDWKLDIWFVDQPDRQPDLAHLRWIPAQLCPETREAILLIKSGWASRPDYGKRVTSVDIYTAVLTGRVRTREDFEKWIVNRHQIPETPPRRRSGEAAGSPARGQPRCAPVVDRSDWRVDSKPRSSGWANVLERDSIAE
jgi:hypothetical protein